MSVKIMSQVFESKMLGPTERLILLSLADHANDEGYCYPSIERLAQRTGLGERTVRRNLRALEDAGYVETRMNAGKQGANLYIVRATPATVTPGHSGPPATDDRYPGHSGPSTPATAAPEPSMNHQEPSKVRAPSFDEFWSSWPLAKTGKQKASAAFKRLSAENKVAATRNAGTWARQWRAKNPDASDMHPSTYLNGKRWEDEFEVKRETVTSEKPRSGFDIPSQAIKREIPPPEDMTRHRQRMAERRAAGDITGAGR